MKHWKLSTVLEVGFMISIYTLRYLKGTWNTSSFFPKEKRRPFKQIHKILVYMYVVTWSMSLAPTIEESAWLAEKIMPL